MAAIVLVFTACAMEHSESSEPPRTPVVVDSSLKEWFRPVFEIAGKEFSAGTAFIIKHGDSFFVLTAHHLFGEAGGLSQEITWQDLPSTIGFVTDQQKSFRSQRPLAVEGAASMSFGKLAADVAMFPLDSLLANHKALTFRRTPVTVDEAVWLVGEVLTEGLGDGRYPAKVSEVTDDYIGYVFAQNIELQATSGAPVVDKRGQVVAINLGGGLDDGKVTGWGNPSTAIVERRTREAVRTSVCCWRRATWANPTGDDPANCTRPRAASTRRWLAATLPFASSGETASRKTSRSLNSSVGAAVSKAKVPTPAGCTRKCFSPATTSRRPRSSSSPRATAAAVKLAKSSEILRHVEERARTQTPPIRERHRS